MTLYWLVALCPAVEDALASLIVDHPNPSLQTRALTTYIKRVYYPYLLSEPTVSWADGVLSAAWICEEPLMAQVRGWPDLSRGRVWNT